MAAFCFPNSRSRSKSMQHGSIGTLREEVLAALNCARLDAQLDASHLDDDTTSALPDPKRLLVGTGKTVRSVRLVTPETLDEPAVRANWVFGRDRTSHRKHPR